MRIRRSNSNKPNPQSAVEDQIKLAFHDSIDLQFKKLKVASLDITLVFLKDISDPMTIQKAIISPLLSASEGGGPVQIDGIPELLPIASIEEVTDFNLITAHLMDGFTIIIVKHGHIQNAYVVDTTKFIKRTPDEPVNEPTISGSRDGFIECIQDNKALLRMHLKSKDLIFEKFTIGTDVITYIYVAYLKGRTKETLVQEVRDRISSVKVDYVTDGGILEQLLERNKFSVFPELTATQHPTKVANALLEGRVSILTDGSPTTLIAPTTLNMLLQTPDDYYFKWIPASLIRLLSYITALISVLLPATYISLVSFQHGLIPTSLAVSLSKTREGVPFPSVIEAFLMEFTIEILREAGVRLPKPIGSTVSIVGAIVIGETAVSSGIVSPMMVMVISFTAICSFAIPNYQLSLALRTIRFFILFSAAMLGIYGMLIAIFIVTTHLVKLRSFSTPFLEPFAPINLKQWKDSFVRLYFRAGAKEDKANE
ncbi:spore germination protein [Pseudalkalibacillus hwajinpoensis]|uniref:Spore germination protein n=1 Tax=Guptibacillus hwajinpoensis TaxID=208199 RepID=A0A4U1MNR6_9BACL|nr:spore germination protein [Pseudalkalibacillus hwajinpoensis]TKD72140.1 spore germination protein [Pseudalkalibacillus hwajinpoensis]